MGFEPTNRGFADPCLTGLGHVAVVLTKTRPSTYLGFRAARGDLIRAGDGIRTHDLLLGKQTFYH